MSTLSSVEEILRNRVKIIDEGEWTLLGTPDDVIKELEALINQQVKSVLDELEGELNTNGAVIHDCGKRVDGVLFTKRTLSTIQKIRSRYE